jgi:hypothetical protein
VTSNARGQAAYWLLVALLFAAQAAYTMAGLERLWYEELAEGIRNPFWLDHRLVYDGVSSNVGWYGLVLIVDKVFGFSPYAAKYARLALYGPFLVCSALLLRQWIGLRRAWLPLLAVGLSPSLLYFNNLGTSYGTDIELFPVVLFLIARVGDRAQRGRARLAITQFSIGATAMIACLIYPSFLFYLPVLLAFHLWANRPILTARQRFEGLAWMTAGFLTPFCAALAYVKNDSVFVYDPATGGAGVFRGGGHALTLDPRLIFQSLSHLLRDLFFQGNTYYFALPHAEFSGAIGLAAAAGILIGSTVIAWKWKPLRMPLVLVGLLCLSSIAAVAFTARFPGLRRSTAFLSGVYAAVACVWAVPALPGALNRAVALTTKLASVLLIVHHLVVYLPNYRYLTAATGKIDDAWFHHFGSPDESVRTWARDWVLAGKPLTCPSTTSCRFSEIYAALEGYLKWSGPGERPVLVVDPKSGRVIQLDIQLWQTWTLRH